MTAAKCAEQPAHSNATADAEKTAHCKRCKQFHIRKSKGRASERFWERPMATEMVVVTAAATATVSATAAGTTTYLTFVIHFGYILHEAKPRHAGCYRSKPATKSYHLARSLQSEV